MKTSLFRVGTAAAAAALAFPFAAVAHAAPATDIDVDFPGCTAAEVSSSKDISNVVLLFADGDRERFEAGTWGRSATFSGTGTNAGETIVTAWVKSGNNHSDDGPGYGERFDSGCGAAPAGQADGGETDGAGETGGGATDGGETDGDTSGGSQAGNAGGSQGGNAGGSQGNGSPGGPNTEGQDTDIATFVQWDSCREIFVHSPDHDISNVVFAFGDGSTLRFEGGDWGRQATFEVGDDIETVWVKAGNNHSGDGSGYGERHDRPARVACSDGSDGGDTTGGDTTGGDTTGGDTGSSDGDDSTGGETSGGDTGGNGPGGSTGSSTGGSNNGGGSTGGGVTGGDTGTPGGSINGGGSTGDPTGGDTVTPGGNPGDSTDTNAPTNGSAGVGDTFVLGVTIDRPAAPAPNTDGEPSNTQSTQVLGTSTTNPVAAAGDTPTPAPAPSADALPRTGVNTASLLLAALASLAGGALSLRRRAA